MATSRTCSHGLGPSRAAPQTRPPQPGAKDGALSSAAIGTNLSAYFILAANSFMQNPVGFRINPETGRAELTDFVAVLTNKVALVTFPHTLSGAFLVAGSLIVAVGLWHVIRNRDSADTDAYRESARRTKGYTKADWQAIKAEGQAAVDAVVGAMRAGKPADSPEAMDAAEMHRAQIDRWFYPVSSEMHVGLAEMYLADPRFTETYEKIAPGLARYLHDAIKANAARSR